MIDQLIIRNKGSVDDFDANVRERTIGEPNKKTIKETVPFSNEIYDFSKINGEIYWGERPLTYVFEIIANSPEELEVKKQEFKSWIMNVFEEELFDPYIEDYHFIATFDSISCDDTEVEKSTITVNFTAYPYMISNIKKSFSFAVSERAAITAVIKNDSSHRITPTFKSDVPFILQIGNSSYGIPAGEIVDHDFWFNVGINTFTLQATPESGTGTVAIEFYEEVF